MTLRADCDLYFRQTGNDQFVSCAWSIGINTCGSSTQNCKPSCFVNANKKVSSCSIASTCNSNNFIGGYGNSQLCVPYNSGPSGSCQPCDWTCTGVGLTTNCAVNSKKKIES